MRALTLVVAVAFVASPAAAATRSVTLPSVVGLTWQAAERKLNAVGMRTSLQTVRSSKPAGIVVAQLPHAHASVNPGTLVHLSVPDTSRATVPQLVGRQKPGALAQLRRLGLAAKIVYVKSLKILGTVVAQSVKAGLEVGLGTRVTLSISSGPGP